MATIKDIAKEAGVSVATVSYVLNDTRYVSPDKKTAVLEAIGRLNYVPNAVARGLRVRASRTLSLILTDITNPFYPDLAKACEDVAQSMGYSLNMINTNDLAERTAQAASQVKEGSADGLIVATALEQDRRLLEEMIGQGYPVVLVHRQLDGLDADTVVSDNAAGGYMAAKHLLGLGHTKIAMMTGVSGSSVSELRVEGYRRAMNEAQLEVPAEWLAPGSARYAPSYEATGGLLDLPAGKRPTAIINISDVGALGVIDAAMDKGLRVPDDLAVIGFDDLFISAMRNTQLTTIRIPRYELGRKATELLLGRINKTVAGESRRLVLPVELIVRRTCGAAQGVQ